MKHSSPQYSVDAKELFTLVARQQSLLEALLSSGDTALHSAAAESLATISALLQQLVLHHCGALVPPAADARAPPPAVERPSSCPSSKNTKAKGFKPPRPSNSTASLHPTQTPSQAPPKRASAPTTAAPKAASSVRKVPGTTTPWASVPSHSRHGPVLGQRVPTPGDPLSPIRKTHKRAYFAADVYVKGIKKAPHKAVRRCLEKVFPQKHLLKLSFVQATLRLTVWKESLHSVLAALRAHRLRVVCADPCAPQLAKAKGPDQRSTEQLSALSKNRHRAHCEEATLIMGVRVARRERQGPDALSAAQARLQRFRAAKAVSANPVHGRKQGPATKQAAPEKRSAGGEVKACTSDQATFTASAAQHVTHGDKRGWVLDASSPPVSPPEEESRRKRAHTTAVVKYSPPPTPAQVPTRPSPCQMKLGFELLEATEDYARSVFPHGEYEHSLLGQLQKRAKVLQMYLRKFSGESAQPTSNPEYAVLVALYSKVQQ